MVKLLIIFTWPSLRHWLSYSYILLFFFFNWIGKSGAISLEMERGTKRKGTEILNESKITGVSFLPDLNWYVSDIWQIWIRNHFIQYCDIYRLGRKCIFILLWLHNAYCSIKTFQLFNSIRLFAFICGIRGTNYQHCLRYTIRKCPYPQQRLFLMCWVRRGKSLKQDFPDSSPTGKDI